MITKAWMKVPGFKGKVELNVDKLANGEFEISDGSTPACPCSEDLASVAYVSENKGVETELRVTCGACCRSFDVFTVKERAALMPRPEAWVNVVRLDAGNDRSGNPRRMFVVIASVSREAYKAGDVIAYIDEGYAGDVEVKRLFPRYVVGSFLTFATTPAEYRNLLNQSKGK